MLDGTVSVRNTKGKSKDVSAGNKATVRQGGKIVGPEPYSPDELPAFLAEGASGADSFPTTIILALAVAVAVALALVTTMLRRRRPAASAST